MRRLPAEPEPLLLGWFLACLLLSGVVFGAFVAFGDVSNRTQARLIVLQPAADTRKMAIDCAAKNAPVRFACLPDRIDKKLMTQK